MVVMCCAPLLWRRSVISAQLFCIMLPGCAHTKEQYTQVYHLWSTKCSVDTFVDLWRLRQHLAMVAPILHTGFVDSKQQRAINCYCF